jgi:hypothetical protein
MNEPNLSLLRTWEVNESNFAGCVRGGWAVSKRTPAHPSLVQKFGFGNFVPF